jgi:hypothetical protein
VDNNCVASTAASQVLLFSKLFFSEVELQSAVLIFRSCLNHYLFWNAEPSSYGDIFSGALRLGRAGPLGIETGFELLGS